MTLKGIFPVVLVLGAALVTSGQQAAPGRMPVLVELFTSEGCSSCPPADLLLMRLDAAQPVESAEVIVLSQHVDYWNNQGWTDPFSSKDFTRRQEVYANTFHNADGPYTPEMVVDGHAELNGSDAPRALKTIAEAAHTPKASVSLVPSATPDGKVHFQVRVTGLADAKLSGKADVYLAISENGLQSNVLRGENSGKNIAHSGVVRRLSVIGAATKDGFSGEHTVALDKTWKRENLHAVIFVQERSSKRIVGAAVVAIPSA